MKFLSKANIRKKMIADRKKMTHEQVEALSDIIINKVKKIPIYNKSKTVMVYLSFGNEVDSKKLIEDCLKSGKRVLVPFCQKDGMKLIPTEIKDMESDLVTDDMGYIQPRKDSIKPVDTEEIDLIVLPGIAFDRKGFRVGFGAGYYDRFLGKLNFSIPTIGVAYDFQMIESFINMESYDIPVDYVITEERIVVRTE